MKFNLSTILRIAFSVVMIGFVYKETGGALLQNIKQAILQ